MCFDVRCVDASRDCFCAAQELQSSHDFLMGVLQATDQAIEEDFKVPQLRAKDCQIVYPVVGI